MPNQKNSLPPLPRSKDNDYSSDAVGKRRQLAEQAAGRQLKHISGQPVALEEARNKIESLIGFAQVPLGLAGPMQVDTAKGRREVYVPLATTEGAMVASFNRGMQLLNSGGGVRARVIQEGLTQCPMFVYRTVADAQRAQQIADSSFDQFAELTTKLSRYGRLKSVKTHLLGRRLVVALVFTTADAIGINMATSAADACSRFLKEKTAAVEHYVHGQDFEKRSSHRSLLEGRGRSVVADAVVSRAELKKRMRVTPEQLVEINRSYSVGFAHMGTPNYTIQSGNALAAIFIACGQDAAYVTESATGFLEFDCTDKGDLYTSVYLPSLMVGTVGGGSNQGTAAECLEIIGCRGEGHANTFAEIIAATVLAGDISLMAAFCSHEFVDSHERLGRNRPA